MKIKLIDYGYKIKPKRAHDMDTGADVYAPISMTIYAGSTQAVPLGFGIEVPNGYSGFIFPRSGLSRKGISCELPPIDAGYTGQVHAIITNHTPDAYQIKEGDRIGQLVILPCVIADFVDGLDEARGAGAFGSTGR